MNNFLSDTEFPYDSSASNGNDEGPGGIGRFGGPREKDDFAGPDKDEDFGKFGNPDGNEGGAEEGSYEQQDRIARTETSNGITISGTYETARDYINALNADTRWVSYDDATNTATITSIGDFVKAFKNVSNSLGAFDQLDAGQGEFAPALHRATLHLQQK